MSEGELLQIQKSRQLNIDEETYLKIIGDKTASLLSTCTEIGAASTTQDPLRRQQMRDFGEHVGIAFQIRDDLLDYVARRSVIGKPTGIDLKEKKLTLPLIHALNKGARSDAKQAIRIIKNGAKRKDVQWIIDFVKNTGGIEYAIDRAEHFSQLAREDLATLPDSESKEALLEFVAFVMKRKS
jgi:octaprenyl-diphosphate synthase